MAGQAGDARCQCKGDPNEYGNLIDSLLLRPLASPVSIGALEPGREQGNPFHHINGMSIHSHLAMQARHQAWIPKSLPTPFGTRGNPTAGPVGGLVDLGRTRLPERTPCPGLALQKEGSEGTYVLCRHGDGDFAQAGTHMSLSCTYCFTHASFTDLATYHARIQEATAQGLEDEQARVRS